MGRSARAASSTVFDARRGVLDVERVAAIGIGDEAGQHRREPERVVVGAGQRCARGVVGEARVHRRCGRVAVDAEHRACHPVQTVAVGVRRGAEELRRPDLACVDLVLPQGVELGQRVGHSALDRRAHLGGQLVGFEVAIGADTDGREPGAQVLFGGQRRGEPQREAESRSDGPNNWVR